MTYCGGRAIGQVLARPFATALVMLSCFTILAVAQQPTTSPREQLKQYIGDLQKNPSDDALREKIIKLALTLGPEPAIPEEARRHFVKADTLARDAHAGDDFPPAINEYQQALALAPWWPDAYRDLAIIQETAGRYDDAKKNLHFYLLANPGEKESRAAQDEIYKIEAKQQESAKHIAEQSANDEKLRRAKATMFAHRWYEADGHQVLEITGSSGAYVCRLEPSTWPMSLEGNPSAGTGRQWVERCEISGTHVAVRVAVAYDLPSVNYHVRDSSDYDLSISDDGKQLRGTVTGVGHGSHATVYVRRD
jgi:hypothetical protein